MNTSKTEIERRYKRLREAMIAQNIDALVVCGNQYAGFEGGVRYVSGFEIVHRYAYVLFPMEGEPTLLFPTESRWIGDKKKPWVQQQVWTEVSGKWLRDAALQHGWKRIGVVGMDFVMAVRDYRELEGRVELVPFDFHFDLARAVKSGEEMPEIRDSMDIIVDGFWSLVASYAPGRTEAEIMAPAIKVFFERGAGSRMMNMVLSGPQGEAEAAFKLPGHRVITNDKYFCRRHVVAVPAATAWQNNRRVIPSPSQAQPLRDDPAHDSGHSYDPVADVVETLQFAEAAHRSITETDGRNDSVRSFRAMAKSR